MTLDKPCRFGIGGACMQSAKPSGTAVGVISRDRRTVASRAECANSRVTICKPTHKAGSRGPGPHRGRSSSGSTGPSSGRSLLLSRFHIPRPFSIGPSRLSLGCKSAKPSDRFRQPILSSLRSPLPSHIWRWSAMTFIALARGRCRTRPASYYGLTSFISHAVTFTFGFGVLTGGAVRMRLYRAWDVKTDQVLAIVVLCALSFWAGLAATAGICLTLNPHLVATLVGLNVSACRILGLAILAALALWLIFVALRPVRIEFGNWRFPLPGPRASLAAIIVGMVDVAAAATALWVLLAERSPSDGAGFLRGVFTRDGHRRRQPRAGRIRRVRCDNTFRRSEAPDGVSRQLSPALPARLLHRAGSDRGNHARCI